MNTGVISTRYARALLKYVTSTGRADEVYAQVKSLLGDPSATPSELEPELGRFVQLVVSKGRRELLREMLTSFAEQYRHSRGIKVARLTTAVPSADLEERLKSLLCERTGCTLEMETRVNPDIIGGFILKVDDLMLDASVSRQIELIRRQFIQKNNRIVYWRSTISKQVRFRTSSSVSSAEWILP